MVLIHIYPRAVTAMRVRAAPDAGKLGL